LIFPTDVFAFPISIGLKPMSSDAFTAPGRFFKGNLHTHSTRSDGKLEPEEVCRRYRERGYDFLCLSDHFLKAYDFPLTDTTAYRTDRFTTILGAELHASATSGGDHWHILAVGLPADFTPPSADESGPQLAERAYQAGAFVAIPHPEWYALTIEDARTIANAHAVEVYNHTSQVHCSRGGGSYFLDHMLIEGRKINALACDDAHFNIPGDVERDAFGGWVMVKAEANEPEALLAALKAGHYYSTQGPDIHDIRREDDELVVTCSPSVQIMLLGRHARSSFASGSDMTEARLPLTRFAEGWGRLAILDAAGRCAWSNPMWF
jgi:hypothetical protein